MANKQQTATTIESLFAGNTETAAMMRSLDWSQTPLGPVENWSQSLKTCVRITLTCRQPMFVWWGEQLINIYNDAYRSVLGGKHPQALGQPASVVWAEIWDQVGPRADQAMLNNEGTYDEALLLIMERNGYPEETYYTFSYSPVPDDEGGTGGIICANSEDTQRIIGERQLALLRELAANTADARTFDDACSLSAKCLETNPLDLPFAMIYLVDSVHDSLFLAGTCGIDRNHPAVPQTAALDSNSIWPFAEVIQTQKPCVVENLPALFEKLPTGAWSSPPHQAVAVPLAASGQTGKAGILVAGLNPYRLFDDNYQGFITLVAAQIAASIGNAQAYEEERKRAEALAELDRAKTAFFSNVSHEFRTPLTLMLGPLEDSLQSLADRLQPAEREQLETVQRNSLRLLKLVNSLLDFSRIEAGRIQASYEPTDLSAFTAELASVFRSAIEKAGMRLVVDCSPLPESIYVDRVMWEKIVFNLLSNAFKFTFCGEIRVAIKYDNDRVNFTVQDTGTGIPPEQIPHLFERFHRVPGAQGRTFEGSGIGLSLVQELVKLHGGSIEVSSVVDAGTTFKISIPTGCAHLPAHQIQATRSLSSTAVNASAYIEEAVRWLPEEKRVRELGQTEIVPVSASRDELIGPSGRQRILLADDNADMRDYVKRLLAQHYEVTAVRDGMAALAVIEQQMPDLVLTDIMMPNLDGFGLLSRLRANPATQNLPIILLSARAGEEARVEGLEAGADDYLIKPFSARELLARVESTLKIARIRREATQREQVLRLEAEEAKENLEEVLRSINDGFFVFDAEWRYVYVNERSSHITHLPREEVLGRVFWEVFPDLVDTVLYREYHRAVELQKSVQFEYFYAGWNCWYENRVYPLENNGVSVFVTDITARKNAEAALQESEERLQLALVAAKMIAWEWNPHTNTLITSSNFANIYGISPVQSVEEGLALVQAEDKARHSAALQNALVTKTGYFSEFRVTRPDNGATVWLEERGEPVFDAQGNVQKLIGVTIDVSERKQAEFGFRESERRFRRLVESNVFGVVFGDSQGGLHYANDYVLKMLGYSSEEVGRGFLRWDGLTPAGFASLDQKAIEEMATQGVCTPYEKVYLHKNGTPVPILVGAAMLQEPYNSNQEIIAFILNLTEIKLLEAERNELRDQTERFFALAVDMLAIANFEGYFIQLNPSWERTLGFSVAELMARPYIDFVHPDDRAATMAVGENLAQGIATIAFENRYLCRDGSYRWISWNVVPVPERNVLYGVAHDVTERKLAEVERSQLLAREQLAREQAEQANRIKDEFLAVLSHELRTPLNPILGWAKMLLTGRLDAAKTRLAVETIERNAKLQTQLIEDLLDVSRILQGKLSLHKVRVDLRGVIEAALETVRLGLEAKSLCVESVFDWGVGAVLGDPARLQQVFWNLLSNAVKFTPEGGRISVCLRNLDSYIQIEVSDTGRGIEPDFLPFVFEYFRQADGSTTRTFGGLGLGLAIVRHLVELHGGMVQAESLGVGMGSTFTVMLPVLKEDGDTAADDFLNLDSPALSLSGVRILVVDDDADTLDFLAFVLEQFGGVVTAVASAEKAILVIKKELPDILLSDIGMPDMDGYMLVREVGKFLAGVGKSLPAIALTAYAGEIDRQQAFSAGFVGHISKPVEPEMLVEMIASFVNLGGNN
ncbi:ATP-binding protein [Ancylothrix sp. D3o]|uniref:ATP-binding protein n=1 Tax=Ancylothrix sp. D3o TaxID=2953691 RepID=UPI0021BAE7A9|nr:ATP-binding protein [Ancylothrix sp. D3o]